MLDKSLNDERSRKITFVERYWENMKMVKI